jgi:hypothetical protein
MPKRELFESVAVRRARERQEAAQAQMDALRKRPEEADEVPDAAPAVETTETMHHIEEESDGD